MAQIIITHGIPQKELSRLSAHIVHYPGFEKSYSRDELFGLLPGADAILAGGAIDAEMIAAATKLKIISNYGAGYERVDVQAATERKIPVTNIPDATAIPTAEIAIGLLLACARRISELDAKLRVNPPETMFGMGKYMGVSLEGGTLGIIGMGRIGSIVAQFGRLIGMQVYYYNRNILSDQMANGATYMPLDKLMAQCDFISIHCPLTESTKGLISKEKLNLMKPGAFLINTARGAIVDYNHLEEMLRDNKIKGAGLDVFHDEPHIPKGLLALENAVLTPHIGTNAVNARDNMAAAACERILAVLNNKRPPNVINPEIYDI